MNDPNKEIIHARLNGLVTFSIVYYKRDNLNSGN